MPTVKRINAAQALKRAQRLMHIAALATLAGKPDAPALSAEAFRATEAARRWAAREYQAARDA